MEQTVYADLYFLINFSMDFLCFFLTARLLSYKLSLARTLMASALGGIYAVAALFFGGSALAALLLDMVICALMCAVALFRAHEARRLPLYILVYIAISMVLGGVMTALFHLFNRLDLPLAEVSEDGISVWLFAILGALGGLVTHACNRFFSRRAARRHAEVRVTCGACVRSLHALCDTGNSLREPIGGRPCIVVDCDRLCGLLPRELLSAAKKGELPSTELMARHGGRICLVPAQSATGSRMLIAFRPDRVTVDSGQGAHTVDALIVPSPLANTADALLPPELMI